MALAILLTYALQFYVPVEVIWPKIQARVSNAKYHTKAEYAFRIGLVLISGKILFRIFLHT